METNAAEKKYGRHVMQIDADISLCAGCNGCEIVCSLMHEGVASPSFRRIFVERDTHQLMHKVHTCQHCEDHPCYNNCPKKDKAMCLDAEANIAYVNQEECIGCGKCMRSCPFTPPRIQMSSKKPKVRKAMKCDLCRTREGGPACIEDCQVLCIQMSDEPIPAAPEKAPVWENKGGA